MSDMSLVDALTYADKVWAELERSASDDLRLLVIATLYEEHLRTELTSDEFELYRTQAQDPQRRPAERVIRGVAGRRGVSNVIVVASTLPPYRSLEEG